MADWGNIPSEIASVIAEHLEKVEDYEAFALVYSSWRRGAKECKFGYEAKAWLMLPRRKEGGPEQRQFYSLCNRKVRTVNLPLWFPHGYNTRLLSSHGWLLPSATDEESNLFILNPMSGAKINLPKVACLIGRYHAFIGKEILKFILSGNPSSSSDFTIALVAPAPNFLGPGVICFWRHGCERWQTVFTDKELDVTFYKGNFYGVNDYGNIWCYEFDQSTGRPHQRLVAKLEPTRVFTRYLFPKDYSTCRLIECYLVESENRLLLVIRLVWAEFCNPSIYRTMLFKVYELNVNNGEAKHVPDLGDIAIFVGWNSSFSVKASSFAHDENIHRFDGIIKPEHCYENSYANAPYVWLQDPSL
ncbi:F-box/kelch-repeat protein At3g18720-like [Chenopodium quinoa]|uniref:F-box/kelch-repeat protein At3g18720-like n=1 Tax=Chenopodium quinoa TaxID=63459 RepID=UPI000B76CB5F|nr:F-box/kelch-repeat protein At3g18720-like [Chenopodium quinoa]